MNIGICDDLEKEQIGIKKICESLGETNIYIFSNSNELLHSNVLPNIDLLFLDIELKDDTLTGIDIKNILENQYSSTFIVFCTTHQELMPDAFGKNVLSFLNKPFSKQAIKNCLEKAAYLKKDFLPIQINEKDIMLCKDILYLNSEHKYTIFYNLIGDLCMARKPLKKWIIELEPMGFCQISRSTVINLKHYIKYNQHNNTILLHSNKELKISRRYINSFKESLHNYQLKLLRNGQ